MKDVNPEYVRTVISLSDTPETRAFLEKTASQPGLRAYASWLCTQKLAGFEMQKGNFGSAAAIWQKYAMQFPSRAAQAQELIGLLTLQDASLIHNLGRAVNSPANDYLPIPELSGQKIYFTSTRPGGSGREDIWATTRGKDGWDEARPVRELNTADSESPDGISADGNLLTLTFFGTENGSLGDGDIFESRLTSQGFGKPVHLPPPINSRFFEGDATYSPDGKALIFASDRPNSYFSYHRITESFGGFLFGNTDLYVSFKQPDGSWGLPRNLGPFINTPGAERTPYLYADGKTLYFSSDGYNGFGRADVYKSIRLDDTWLHWSTPINLGPLVNGPGQDWGFRLTAASDRGYFSGELAGTFGGQDLYEVVPLPIAARPAQIVIAVRGFIKDEKGNPIESEIEWQDLATGQSLGTLSSKPGTGEFFVTLPAGRDYAYFAHKDGYLNQSEHVDLTYVTTYEEKHVEIKLISIAAAQTTGAEIVLNNIFFETASATLNPRSYGELNRLVAILKQNPGMRIEVQGHTDSTGDPTFNLNLSGKRAWSVANYLAMAGIQPARVQVRGFGSSKPVDSNATEAGRQRNRRVSFVVLPSP